MAQDRCSTILAFVQELVQEQMDGSAKGVECKVPNVFCKVERCEGQRKGEMRKSGL